MTPSRSSLAAPSSEFAVSLLGELRLLGVRDVVLSPGSRSQALALAVAEYERLELLRLHVRIDERVAGFVALGLAVETGVPVVVVTTSGTAVANLHPAVLEAHHSGVPLIVITADRPDALRGIGSNQTAEQPGIFGPAITRSFEVGAPVGQAGEADVAAIVARQSWSAALSGTAFGPGPVHLNVAFAEPLSGPIEIAARFSANRSEGAFPERPVPVNAGAAFSDSGVATLSPAWGTVVVAGAGAGARAEAAARALGAPLLAEVSSGARFGPNLVVAYRELLAENAFGGAIDRVVVFGHPTLSREVPALIGRAGIEALVVRTPGADDYNPGRRVVRFVSDITVESGGASGARTGTGTSDLRAWVGQWVAASRAILEPDDSTSYGVDLPNGSFARRQLATVREPVTRRMLVDAVWQATWPHDRLVLGASRLIREADKVVPGKKITVHANRGLAGIDGTIATALGIALASQVAREDEPSASAAGTTRVLLGDLAALHDAGALALGEGERRPRVQVIVGNDGGGTIFDGLEVAGTAPMAALDRVLLTPQRVAFDSLAAAYGWEYLRVTNRGELDEALAASVGPMLIEVPLAR